MLLWFTVYKHNPIMSFIFPRLETRVYLNVTSLVISSVISLYTCQKNNLFYDL